MTDKTITTTVDMTTDQLTGFLASVPPGADIERRGDTITVSAVHRLTQVRRTVFHAQEVRHGAWKVTGPARLFVARVVGG